VEPTLSSPGAGEPTAQYVTFFIDSECFAFPLGSVLEVIRVPELVRVPMAPGSLLGLASLRGSMLPVLDLRRVLSLTEAAFTDATRVVVADVGTPVGLVVDRVAQVLEVDRQKIESSQGIQSTVRAELMTGVVKDVGGRSLVQLLDVARCVGLEFAALVDTGRQSAASAAAGAGEEAALAEDDGSLQIVSFLVDGQEYAFPISDVEEIVRLPEEVSRVPRAEHTVLGLINLRSRLLPLVGMRRIFGLPEAGFGEATRVLVVTLGGAGATRESAGFVVDQVREVLRVEAGQRDPVPALVARSGGQDRIASVCRLGDGKRLVSVLSCQALLAHQAVQAAVGAARPDRGGPATGPERHALEEDDEEKLVVFRLDAQEYGVPVEAIQEIIRVPAELSRVPRTEAFVEGMVDLRGAVLPVVDLRSRLGLDRAVRNDRQRILVFNLAGACTGYIVDAVSEVLRVARGALERAPRLSEEHARLMGRVVNLRSQQRMIQVVDAGALVGPPAAAA
jgi:purine-binding chemotaxis protein CheW